MLSLSVNLVLILQLFAAVCSAVLAVLLMLKGFRRVPSLLTIILFFVYIVTFLLTDHKVLISAIYTLWYLIYLIYITISYISELHRHLDASMENKAPDDELTGIEDALKIWVDQKRYCEYDQSREEIAKELNTTKENLHHYFMTRKGKDFKAWRTELRIEEAKKMLIENSDFPINIIGELAGFSDRSNFHRQFVKSVGCSPRQWRDSGGKL